jgi:glycosyltransferase involved in cell wall biosynthesis
MLVKPVQKIISNRIKVAFVAPCIGLGGADALMQGLVKYAHNLDFTGIAVSGETDLAQIRWFEKCLNWGVPIHQPRMTYTYPGVNYHETFGHAVYNAVKEANIIFTWSQPNLHLVMQSIDLPVIEYAQNSDDNARAICASNEGVTNYQVACSQAAKEAFPPGEETQVIYNGIDPGRIAPRKGRAMQRKLWNIPDDKKVLLFMGRFEDEKHPHAVIQALTKLPEDWIGLFVGHGSQQPNLFNMAKRFVPGRTCFVKSEYHVGDFLAAADCFILPSDFEGHPLSLMEAMLAGVPCVYTDFTVMQELHDLFGPMGTMVPRCSDGETYAAAVLDATAQNEQAFMRMNNAREVVWHNFTLPTIAHNWEQHVEWCLFDYYRKRRFSVMYPAGVETPMNHPER